MSGKGEEVKPCPNLSGSHCTIRPRPGGAIPKQASLEEGFYWPDLLNKANASIACVICLVAQDLAAQAECCDNLSLRSMDD